MTLMRAGRRAMLWVALVILVGATLFPIVWVVRLSVVPPADLATLPPPLFFEPDFSSYVEVVTDTQFLRYLRNSLIAAITSSVVALLLGLPAAYAFARFRFRGSQLFSLSVLFLHVMPPIAMILPFFVIFTRLNLNNNILGLATAHVLITLPLSVWLLRGFVARVPVQLEEAAMVDGASRLKTLWLIVVPVLAPGLAATGVLTFLYSWNDYIYALTLTGVDSRTLPVLLTGFISDRTLLWDRLASAGTLVMLPPLIFGALVQRHLVEGLAAGAVKGG